MTKLSAGEGDRVFWFVSVAIVIFVYFFGLTIPLLGPDEPRYAQVAREMFERGDWITPTLGGHNWFEKPALLYWLQIASYNLFGVSEFSARFGSALFGLGTIFSLWILGKTYERESADDVQTADFANWLALIAASSLGLIVFARGASFDIILTFPMTAAMVSFFVFDRNSSSGRSGTFALFLFYFFVGLALLAKGLVGAVFPFAIIALYYLLSRKLPPKKFLIGLVWGGLVTLIVAAAWYGPMYVQHGWEFIDEFFIQHHFQRYTSNKYLHPQPFHFFFWVLPLMTLPWLPFFFAGIWSAMRSVFYHRGTETQRNGKSGLGDTKPNEEIGGISQRLSVSASPLLLYSAAWLLVPLVFFSFSGSKLPGYILPALPPAIVMTTLYVVRFISKNEVRRSRLMMTLAMATMVVVTALLIFVVPRFAEADSVKGLIKAANERGHGSERVMTLYTVSHNAEFYAAGRLLRDEAGKQRQLNNTGELAEAIRKEASGAALVIVPNHLLKYLSAGTEISSEIIADNSEYTIVFVRPR